MSIESSSLMSIDEVKSSDENAHTRSGTQSSKFCAAVDFDGPPHENPDGPVISCPYIMIREGYGDKWARPLPSNFTGSWRSCRTLRDL